jgi:hypothetical protein
MFPILAFVFFATNFSFALAAVNAARRGYIPDESPRHREAQWHWLQSFRSD